MLFKTDKYEIESFRIRFKIHKPLPKHRTHDFSIMCGVNGYETLGPEETHTLFRQQSSSIIDRMHIEDENGQAYRGELCFADLAKTSDKAKATRSGKGDLDRLGCVVLEISEGSLIEVGRKDQRKRRKVKPKRSGYESAPTSLIAFEQDVKLGCAIEAANRRAIPADDGGVSSSQELYDFEAVEGPALVTFVWKCVTAVELDLLKSEMEEYERQRRRDESDQKCVQGTGDLPVTTSHTRPEASFTILSTASRTTDQKPTSVASKGTAVRCHTAAAQTDPAQGPPLAASSSKATKGRHRVCAGPGPTAATRSSAVPAKLRKANVASSSAVPLRVPVVDDEDEAVSQSFDRAEHRQQPSVRMNNAVRQDITQKPPVRLRKAGRQDIKAEASRTRMVKAEPECEMRSRVIVVNNDDTDDEVEYDYDAEREHKKRKLPEVDITMEDESA